MFLKKKRVAEEKEKTMQDLLRVNEQQENNDIENFVADQFVCEASEEIKQEQPEEETNDNDETPFNLNESVELRRKRAVAAAERRMNSLKLNNQTL